MSKVFIGGSEITTGGLVLSNLPDYLNVDTDFSIPQNSLSDGGSFSYKKLQSKNLELNFTVVGSTGADAQDRILYLQSLASEQNLVVLKIRDGVYDRVYDAVCVNVQVEVNHYNINKYTNIRCTFVVPRGWGELYTLGGSRIETTKSFVDVTFSIANLALVEPSVGYTYRGTFTIETDATAMAMAGFASSLGSRIEIAPGLSKTYTFDFKQRQVTESGSAVFATGDMGNFFKKGSTYSYVKSTELPTYQITCVLYATC